ncbi:MAG: hypothetical protein PVJ81_00740 [Dehalococcoidia bacterium]|jgi:hypothetical protein
MKKYLTYLVILLLVCTVSLVGCKDKVTPTVNLETPTNGSSVSSLTPILSWNYEYADATFRLQLSTDGSFQDLVIDQSDISSPSYTVPSGKLSEGQTYYWKVNATKDDQVSEWSSAWSFQTPGAATEVGTVIVQATLDGSPWTGNVSYTLSGAESYSGSSVNQTITNAAVGSYTLGYNSGGPAAASLANISPSSTQTLSAGGTTTFTLNFTTTGISGIQVQATLDGASWTGNVNYTITGPEGHSGTSVPATFSNLTSGNYTVGYNSGGPAGATLGSISPSPTQAVTQGATATFTLNFHSENTSAIKIQATLNGSIWNGSISYAIHGALQDSASSVPYTFTNLPIGSYSLVYKYGGPPNATLMSITPQPTQTTAANQTTTFTLNFATGTSNTVRIMATLDGQQWSGNVSYCLQGPFSDCESSVPQNMGNLPDGTYAVTYRSGGPVGATFVGISPSSTQTVNSGGTITFNLNFHSAATGTIMVNAMLDGQTWQTAIGSGSIQYSISGPVSDASTTMPDSFSGLPAGTYTLIYNSGGPIGATLSSISPAPTQSLPSGGTISFTLYFTSQANGTVTVNATANGSPWQGSVSFVLSGPYVDSHGSVPYTFDGCPAGSYTLTYRSGGPEGMTLYSIDISATQQLQAGGNITFTLVFVGEGEGGGGVLE